MSKRKYSQSQEKECPYSSYHMLDHLDEKREHQKFKDQTKNIFSGRLDHTLNYTSGLSFYRVPCIFVRSGDSIYWENFHFDHVFHEYMKAKVFKILKKIIYREIAGLIMNYMPYLCELSKKADAIK
jgi:hypothetical protein